jgi:hypothetical protein
MTDVSGTLDFRLRIDIAATGDFIAFNLGEILKYTSLILFQSMFLSTICIVLSVEFKAETIGYIRYIISLYIL